MISEYEKKLKRLLDEELPAEKFIDNYRPAWLTNPATGAPLELDRYYPNLKIGVEYNGQQHRRKKGEAQWERDKLKKHLCARHGVIRLVFYWDELDRTVVANKIKDVFSMRAAWASGKPWQSSDRKTHGRASDQ